MDEECAGQRNTHGPQQHGSGHERVAETSQALAVLVDAEHATVSALEDVKVADHVRNDEPRRTTPLIAMAYFLPTSVR